MQSMRLWWRMVKLKDNKTKYLIIALISIVTSYSIAFILCCSIKGWFSFWHLLDRLTFILMILLIVLAALIAGVYYYHHYWLLNSKNIIKSKKKDLHLESNLEASRFQTEEEISENFKVVEYSNLQRTEITGSLVKAEYDGNTLNSVFAKPSHCLVIGTTGSGKTSTYVNPMIQILKETKTMPSMFISDPKGELYSLHAQSLMDRGYEVKILDLRNPYNSIRWNPLERALLNYQRSIHLDDEVEIDEELGVYFFEEAKYRSLEELKTVLQVKKQQLMDIVYEDLNDIMTAICPVVNKSEPMWESGAKNFILAIALAILEDSENEELGITKDKFNFYSITKVATHTENDCAELIKYFKNRNPLSKAVSLSKQVLDSSDKTRGSYLTTVFDKLSLFSDSSLCSLTSSNEIEFGSMGEKPIALFLQIPDEKETRHTLASIVILQAYKELVAKANESKNLTLSKPVYFILDEFGQLPKINKMEQMITVGRSRNIWMNLIVQSYSQLSKVYEDKSADIIKSNCNIQVFIGTTDYKTIEEFSKRCGNFSMMQRSVGFNSAKGTDISSNTTIKERPLIYPSELQLLNNNQNMGNAIVTIFGYYPIKSKFTPSFQCSYYNIIPIEQRLSSGRYFDEEKAFYDMTLRNNLYPDQAKEGSKESINSKVKAKLFSEQLRGLIIKGMTDVVDDDDIADILTEFDKGDLNKVLCGLKNAKSMANPYSQKEKTNFLSKAISILEREVKEI